jgi:hypothetical protein
MKTPGQRAGADELDNVTGSTEDEFAETMSFIRERELILGQTSLLASFAPLLVEMCKHNSTYSVRVPYKISSEFSIHVISCFFS